MKKRVCFVATGGGKTGLGHIVRCRVLADRLSERGWTVDFALQGEADDEPVLRHIVGYPVVIGRDLPETVGEADLVVVDTYSATAADERRFRKNAGRVLSLEDRPTRAHRSDILLDPTPGRNVSDYSDLADPDCGLLLGPGYALLRDAFAKPPDITEPAGKGPRLFIGFGGADPPQATRFTLDALTGFDGRIDVAIGSLSPQIPDLEAVLATRKDGSRLLIDADAATLAATMRNADLCIGAGGGMLLERCAVGAASLCLEIADNQRDLLAAATDAGAIESLGPLAGVTAAGLRDRVEALLGDTETLDDMRRKAYALCDGRGADRVAEMLTGREVAGKAVTLRPVCESDCATILGWQSEPGARHFARNASIPTNEEHRDWFRNRIEKTSYPFFIIEADGDAAGFLRFDPPSHGSADTAEYEIAILVGNASRGQGIALSALQTANNILAGYRAVAHVYTENKASEKAFRKAGYSESDRLRRLVLTDGKASNSLSTVELERTGPAS